MHGSPVPSASMLASLSSQHAVSASQILQAHFAQLHQHLVDSKLEDFGFDQDTEWSLHSAQVQTLNLKQHLYCSSAHAEVRCNRNPQE